MKIQVRVDGRSYEVEVGDLAAVPVIALVDGRRFEVWPSGAAAAPEAGVAAGDTPPPAGIEPSPPGVTAGDEPAARAASRRHVTAPIPGVVDSIAVHAGDAVARGDELLVLEAMKMRNAIRAPHPGAIAQVLVTVGQHVRHGDPLVEYRDG